MSSARDRQRSLRNARRLAARASATVADGPGRGVAAALETVVAAAFNQRRKMLRSALKRLGPDAGALLTVAGIAPERRAEELDVAEFCTLARAWRARIEATGS